MGTRGRDPNKLGRDRRKRAEKDENFLRRKREAWHRYAQKPETKIKIAARVALREKCRNGTIKREPCCFCGEPKTHGHHEDYSRPFDVIWVCSRCHGKLHKRKA